LASAGHDDVRDAWAGLGYYRRAGFLHACAKAIMALPQAQPPKTAKELAKLPGLGPYTSAALSSICFGEKVMPVDGNIERVVARIEAIDIPLQKARKLIAARAQHYCFGSNSGHIAQAFMDLSARFCRPKNPKCDLCPVRQFCRAAQTGRAETLPVKEPKKQPRLETWHITLHFDDTHVALLRRDEGGIMGGMLGFHVSQEQPIEAQFQGQVSHRLTHILIDGQVYISKQPQITGSSLPRRGADLSILPTLMRKAAERSGLFLH